MKEEKLMRRRLKTLKKKMIMKMLSLALAFFMIFSGVNPAWAEVFVSTPSVTQQSMSSSFGFPNELGFVVDAYQTKQERMKIYHLEDAHAHLGTQNRIKQILDYLYRTEGVDVVFVEGADSSIDSSLFNLFPDAKMNVSAAHRWMKKGQFSAAEVFAIEKQSKVKVLGVENPELYKENLKLFREIYKFSPQALKAVGQWKTQIQKAKDKVYLGDLRVWDQKKSEFENGKLHLLNYLRHLNELEQKYVASPLDLKNIRKLFTLERESKDIDLKVWAQEWLYIQHLLLTKIPESNPFKKILSENWSSLRQGVPSLNASSQSDLLLFQDPRGYFELLWSAAEEYEFSLDRSKVLPSLVRQLIYQKELVGSDLFQEKSALENSIAEALLETRLEKQIFKADETINLYEKLFKLELSRDEAQKIQSLASDWKPSLLTEKIQTIQREMENRVSLLSQLEDSFFDRALRFYEVAREREGAMIQKSLSFLKQERKSKAVLITGGFHGGGIQQKLTEEDVSFLSIRPKAELSEQAHEYLNLILGKDQINSDAFIKSELNKISIAARLTRNSLDAPETLGHMLIRSLVTEPVSSAYQLDSKAYQRGLERRANSLLRRRAFDGTALSSLTSAKVTAQEGDKLRVQFLGPNQSSLWVDVSVSTAASLGADQVVTEITPIEKIAFWGVGDVGVTTSAVLLKRATDAGRQISIDWYDTQRNLDSANSKNHEPGRSEVILQGKKDADITEINIDDVSDWLRLKLNVEKIKVKELQKLDDKVGLQQLDLGEQTVDEVLTQRMIQIEKHLTWIKDFIQEKVLFGHSGEVTPTLISIKEDLFYSSVLQGSGAKLKELKYQIAQIMVLEEHNVIMIDAGLFLDKDADRFEKVVNQRSRGFGEALKRLRALGDRSHKTFIVRSHMPTGRTENIMQTIYDVSGEDDNFTVVYAPELLRKGSQIEDMNSQQLILGFPKVESIVDEDDADKFRNLKQAQENTKESLKALLFPKGLDEKMFVVTDSASAELGYLGILSYLGTKLASFNTIAQVVRKLKGDMGMVAFGAGLDRRVGLHNISPSFAFGGKLRAFLERAASEFDELFKRNERAGENDVLPPQLAFHGVTEVRDSNNAQIDWFKSMIDQNMSTISGKRVSDIKMALLGVAFKGNGARLLASPAKDLVLWLAAKGIKKIYIYDPDVQEEFMKWVTEAREDTSLDKIIRSRLNVNFFEFVDSPEEAIRKSNAVVIAADHDVIRNIGLQKMKRVLKLKPLFDGRNIFGRQSDGTQEVSLTEVADVGINYLSLGRPSVGPSFKKVKDRANMDKVIKFDDPAAVDRKKVVMVGTGYVGLITGTVLSDLGHDVTTLDIDRNKIEGLNQPEVRLPIWEPGLEELVKKNRDDGRLHFQHSPLEESEFYSSGAEAAIHDANIIYIAVGTPEIKEGPNKGEANLAYLLSATRTAGWGIKSNLRSSDRRTPRRKVIVVKSTVPPIAFDKMKEVLVEMDLKEGSHFDIASNPEFLREGSAVHDVLNPDRNVFGVESEFASKKLQELWAPLQARHKHPVVVTDRKSSPMIKYSANVWLAISISFANALAWLSEEVGASYQEVVRIMKNDVRNPNAAFLAAGAGYGGSCFPKDTAEALYRAKESGVDFKIAEKAISTNGRAPMVVVGKIKSTLASIGDVAENTDLPLEGVRIGVLGLAFKANTDDVRETRSMVVIRELLDLGATVSFHDPLEEAQQNFVFDFTYQILKEDMSILDKDISGLLRQVRNQVLSGSRGEDKYDADVDTVSLNLTQREIEGIVKKGWKRLITVKFDDKVEVAKTMKQAIKGSNLIALMTDWDEIKNLDLVEAHQIMEPIKSVVIGGRRVEVPVIMDARNMLLARNKKQMLEAGIPLIESGENRLLAGAKESLRNSGFFTMFVGEEDITPISAKPLSASSLGVNQVFVTPQAKSAVAKILEEVTADSLGRRNDHLRDHRHKKERGSSARQTLAPEEITVAKVDGLVTELQNFRSVGHLRHLLTSLRSLLAKAPTKFTQYHLDAIQEVEIEDSSAKRQIQGLVSLFAKKTNLAVASSLGDSITTSVTISGTALLDPTSIEISPVTLDAKAAALRIFNKSTSSLPGQLVLPLGDVSEKVLEETLIPVALALRGPNKKNIAFLVPNNSTKDRVLSVLKNLKVDPEVKNKFITFQKVGRKTVAEALEFFVTMQTARFPKGQVVVVAPSVDLEGVFVKGVRKISSDQVIRGNSLDSVRDENRLVARIAAIDIGLDFLATPITNPHPDKLDQIDSIFHMRDSFLNDMVARWVTEIHAQLRILISA